MLPRRLLLLLAAGLALTAFASATPQPLQQDGRVVVLGMDGMDAEMAADWMDAGLLPNFARLRDQGSFAPLMPANPAQSPVSWATLNTGVNPGMHGIFDFVGVTRGDRSSPASPTVGFQHRVKITAEEAGVSATGGGLGMFLIVGLVVGTLLFVALRNKAGMVPAALLGVAAIGAGVGMGVMGGGEVPPYFYDWESDSHADPYWTTLDDAGVVFRGQGTIVAYPVQQLEHGKLVAGLGAPDATGGLNSSSVYTTADERQRRRKSYQVKPAYNEVDAPSATTPSGKGAGSVKVYKLTAADGGGLESKLFGPENTWRTEQLRTQAAELGQGGDAEELKKVRALLSNPDLLRTWTPLQVDWTSGAAAAAVTLGGETQQLAMGSWSEFFHVEFPWTPSFSSYAMVRVWVEEIDGELELFASPLQIDPRRPTPGSRNCWPPEFSAQLAEDIGDFETLGWACQTHAVKDAELSDLAFLADIESTHTWRIKMLEDAVADGDWQVLFHFFGTPDRVCHMLMRHMDPRHPQYDEALANQQVSFLGKQVAMKDTGLAIYQRMDEVVGWMLDDVLQPEDTLLIVSDHGFDSFRREVNLNNWLVREGFASLRNRNRIGGPRKASEVDSSYLKWVDWTESEAYSVAIGKIYLNLRGREASGTVPPSEAAAVVDRIVERLYELTDPESGEKVVKKVYRKDEIYSGEYVEARRGNAKKGLSERTGAAELTIDFVEGYRASWSVTGGGIVLVNGELDGVTIAQAGPIFRDNMSPWSGDHCGVDIQAVQGIFFSNIPMSLPGDDTFYDATHLAPTVLDLVGVAVPADYDSQPLTR